MVLMKREVRSAKCEAVEGGVSSAPPSFALSASLL